MSDICHLVNTLTKTDDIFKAKLYYLANILININDILNIAFYYQANTLTNTKNKTNDFIKKKFGYILSTTHFLSLGDN